MTGTWTDDDLDAALADLARTLDRDAHDDATLAAVRGRLIPAAGPDTEQATGEVDLVVMGGPRRAGRVRMPSGRVLATAAVVAAFAVGAAVGALAWPRGDAGRSEPGGVVASTQSRSSSSDPSLAAALLAVTDPAAPGGATVLARTGGRGAGEVTVDLGSQGAAVTYSFTCAADGSDPSPVVRVFTVSDSTRVDLLTVRCGVLGDGAPDPVTSTAAVTRVGRPTVSVGGSSPDVVWKVVVSSRGGG